MRWLDVSLGDPALKLSHDPPVVEIVPQPPSSLHTIVGGVEHARPCVEFDHACIAVLLRRLIPDADTGTSASPFEAREIIGRQIGKRWGFRLVPSARYWSVDKILGQ